MRMWSLRSCACYHSRMGAAETKAHKRGARTDKLTTATLDASNFADGGVLVLCVSDVLTKNDRYVRTKHGTAESSLSKAYKAAVARAALGAGFVPPVKVAASKLLRTKVGTIYGDKTITAGVWSLEVLSIWPTQRHLKDTAADLANGDSDAPLSMVRDAMQRAGIIDDDMRIVSDRTFSLYIKDERRTVARLRRLDATDAALRRGLIDDLLRDEEWARRPGSAVLG